MKSLRLEEIIDSNVIGLVKGTKDQSSSFKHPYIKMNNVTTEGKLDIKDLVFVEASSDEVKKYTVTKGDLLFNTRNSAQLVGKSCIYDLDTDSLYNNNLMRLRFKDGILGNYIQYQFYSKKVRAQIKKFTNSTTNVAAIYFKNLKSLELKIPLLEEQKKIAAILDAADDYRQKTKALIEKYDQLTQSLFLDMFGDPVTNPMGWVKQKVEDVATIVRGSSPRPKGDPRYYGSGVPRLMVADLTRDGLYVTPKIDSLTMEGAKKSRSMSRGELVMAVSGRPGLTAILEENCCIHDGFAGFKDIDNQYRTEFLCHYFHHFISQVSKVSAGAIFKNITTNDIRMIDLLIIPLERQDHFLTLHQSILKSKIQAEASLVKAEELFSSLLQRAFKGELTS